MMVALLMFDIGLRYSNFFLLIRYLKSVGKHNCISHFLKWQLELQSKYNVYALVWISKLFHVFPFHVIARRAVYP